MSPEMGDIAQAEIDSSIATHAADLDAHTYNSLEILRTGEYFSPLKDTSTTLTFEADDLRAIPFYVARAITVDRIAIQVTSAAAGKSCRLGIYNDGTNLYPGTLLLDAGEVSVASVAVVAATISQALTKGLYWLAVLSEGTPTLQAWRGDRGLCSPCGIRASALANCQTNWRKTNVTYGALPDPFTSAGTLTGSTHAPAIALRIASLD